jgi:hypothetical protein
LRLPTELFYLWFLIPKIRPENPLDVELKTKYKTGKRREQKVGERREWNEIDFIA